ncbi:MAG: ABC transporter substrate-binding protein [Thaumarchaeota archaeon]|nr:ABC transporter substrate-binding protein [Nitrososphaerota archaeon]
MHLASNASGLRTGKVIASLALLLILGFLPLFQTQFSLGRHAIHVAAQTPTQCTTANTLRITDIDDPNSFNLLDAIGAASFNVDQLQWGVGLWPKLAPNGTMIYAQSDINWFSHNANYTQWKFNLRPGLTWSNGQPVNASDVLATFSPNFDFNPNYNPLGTGSEVSKVSAVNNSLVVFELNRSDAHFAEQLTSQEGVTGTYPASMVALGPSNNFFGITNIADGPFYVRNYTSGTHQLILYRNPYFKPQPSICQIDINFLEGTTNSANYIASDGTDLAALDATLVQTLSKDPHAGILDQKAAEAQLVYWNTSSYPYNQLAFRQAIAYGINDSQIISQDLNGFGLVGHDSQGFVPSTTTLLYNPSQTIYSYNQNKSLQLLQSINMTLDSNALLTYPNKTEVSLKLWVDSDTPSDLLSADTMQSELAKIGITVTIISLPEATIFSYIRSDVQGVGHDMFLDTHGGAIPPSAWLDAQPISSSIYFGIYTPQTYLGDPHRDAEYQSNLSAIDMTSDPQLEHQYLNNIQSLLSASLPNLVVSWPDSIFAYNTLHWTGFGQYPQGWYQMYATVNWDYLLNLSPASATTSTATSTLQQTSPTNSSATSATGTNSIPTPTTATATVTVTNTGTGSSTGTTEIALGVIIVILVVAISLILMRRRPRAATG